MNEASKELRSQGIGASEVAAILGMDPRRDAFAVWARKLGLIDEADVSANIRVRKGRYFEQGIAKWYADQTESLVRWFDETVQHPGRTWQLCTPDLYVYGMPVIHNSPMPIGGADCKLVSWDQREGWGESGTQIVPDHYAIQCQWTTSTVDLPWWDLAPVIGDELRVYRIHRDPKVESVLLEVVDKFWHENVLKRKQPPIGATAAAREFLQKTFPKNTEIIRIATPEEAEIIERYLDLKETLKSIEKDLSPIENELKQAIGEDAGLRVGNLGVTWKKDADSKGTDWRALAQEYALRLEAFRAAKTDAERALALADIPGEEAFEVVTRVGPRKLLRKTWK